MTRRLNPILLFVALVAASLAASAPGSDTSLAPPPPLHASAIVAGDNHTCALTGSGAAKCWGDNEYGQLGDGTTTSRVAPVAVSGLVSGVSLITAGAGHTCAVVGGAAKCWGANSQFLGGGQVGDGTTTDRSTPVDVIGLDTGVSAISAGGHHTCALIASGGDVCWGFNPQGQIGDGTTTGRHAPVGVTGLSAGVSAIGAGGHYSCALVTGGGLKCWGDNANGALGDGTRTERHTPVQVVGLSSGVSAIAASPHHLGGFFACALVGGGAKCWGDNSHGQLGDGTTTERTTPVEVSGFSTGAVALAAGGNFTCALTGSAGVKCWGANDHGQLGDGTTTDHSLPAEVSGLGSGVSAIAAGSYHACALMSTGEARCWGRNNLGQVGDGTKIDRKTPVSVLSAALLTCVVPNVRGKKLAAARRGIVTRKCSVGAVRRAYSKKVKKGRVSAQKPGPGKVLAAGGKVSLVVSKGKRR